MKKIFLIPLVFFLFLGCGSVKFKKELLSVAKTPNGNVYTYYCYDTKFGKYYYEVKRFDKEGDLIKIEQFK